MTAPATGLEWPRLVTGTLIQRYKRFLADVRLETGEMVTAHCPNSGSMQACAEPGRPVYLSWHDNPRRKLAYTWEMIRMPGSLVGVNTQVPNRLVYDALAGSQVPEVAGYARIRREVSVSKGSRIDLMLENSGEDRCFVEVKNCTLVRQGRAMFPDAVTARGLKHLKELQRLKADGARCVMFFLIQRMDALYFEPADAIDPDYGRELRRAVANGVEVLVYDVLLDLERIRLNNRIAFNHS